MHIHAVTRNSETAWRLRRSGIRVIEALLQDDVWHSSVPKKPAYAVNCVGSSDRTIEGYRRSYVEGMRSITKWAAHGPPGVFVYTSSTSVYGSASGSVDEDTVPADLSSKNRILVEAEKRVSDGSISQRWFILRLAGLYGPGRHRLLDRVRAKDPDLAKETDRNLNAIHRDDACRAIFACLEAGPEVAPQVFNLTDDGAARRAEVIDWLTNRTLGEDPPGNRQRTNEGGLDRRVPDRLVSNKRIREVLGWQPTYPGFRAGYEAILKEEQKT
jgi:nucleoside-diphosphate-sugar epimerase